jgi:hypothetical protein
MTASDAEQLTLRKWLVGLAAYQQVDPCLCSIKRLFIIRDTVDDPLRCEHCVARVDEKLDLIAVPRDLDDMAAIFDLLDKAQRVVTKFVHRRRHIKFEPVGSD